MLYTAWEALNGVSSLAKPSHSILCALRPGEWLTPLKSCFLARLCSRESQSINWRSMGRERRRKEQKEEEGGGEKRPETGHTHSLLLLYLSSWGFSTCLCHWKEELLTGKTEMGILRLSACSLPQSSDPLLSDHTALPRDYLPFPPPWRYELHSGVSDLRSTQELMKTVSWSSQKWKVTLKRNCGWLCLSSTIPYSVTAFTSSCAVSTLLYPMAHYCPETRSNQWVLSAHVGGCNRVLSLLRTFCA